jgi:type I restriction enzyme R subunit
MSLITEKRDVQDQLINHLIGIGWEYLPRPLSLVARQRQRAAAARHRPAAAYQAQSQLGHGQRGRILPAAVVPPTIAGNEGISAPCAAITGDPSVEKREYNLTLLDYTDLSANTFHFTGTPFADQPPPARPGALYQRPALGHHREQSPTLPDLEIRQRPGPAAYTQDIPNLLKFTHPVARDLRLPTPPGTQPQSLYTWKVEDKDYGLERLSKSMLDRQHLLNILQDYLIFTAPTTRPSNMCCASSNQGHRAGRAAVLDQTAPTGLVWHTQGSGKTLTMIVTARCCGG